MAKTSLERKMVEKLLEKMEMDTVLFHLTQIAYSKRDAEDHKDGNKAERDYWHKVGAILSDTEEKVSDISAAG